MNKLISGVLLLSILLNGSISAFAVSTYSQTMIINETKNAASTLIQNYCQYLVGNAQINNNTVIRSKLSSIEKNAEKALAAYQGIQNPYVMFLGDGYDMSDTMTVDASPITSDPFYKNSQYLYDMALAYATNGTKYYKNAGLKQKLIEALQAFYQVYHKHIAYKDAEGKLFGNWWNWEIGVPTHMTSILALMQQDIQAVNTNLITNYIKDFDNHLRNGKNGDVDLNSPTHTGTNLIDITANRMVQGALLGDTKRIEKAVRDMMTVFNTIDPYHIINNNTDGVYADGSFIQHHRVAYTGSYGKLLLQKAVSSLYVLKDTPWQPQDKVSTIENWIYNSFLPLIHEGYMSEVVKGRAVSRSATGYSDTTGVIEAMTLLTTFLSESNSKKMQQQIKYVVQSMPVKFDEVKLNLPAIEPYRAIMNDRTIFPVNSVQQGSVVFNAMDRNLQLSKDFTFALSRSSNRIAKYEYMSGENLKPWFQGDGAFYLYLSGVDQTKQYGINYFTTVNPYRLPGTTVPNETRRTSMELYNGSQFYPKYTASSTEQNDYVYFPVGTNAFSGSVYLKEDSVSMAGMQLGDENGYVAKQKGLLPDDFVAYKNATGNKSWFLMNDQIVFMGSGIGDAIKRDVTTTIDNRMSAPDAKVTVMGQDNAGKEVPVKDGRYSNLKWLCYQDESLKTSIGYYFPQAKEIQIATPTITENQKNIRNVASQTDNMITQKYFTMTYEHGKNTDDSYSYVLIPNATEEKMKQYAAKPDIEIVENSKTIHAVRNTKSHITAINFFESGKTAGVQSSKPLSLLMKQIDGNTTIALSDPLFTQDTIQIILDISNAKVVTKDDRIQAVCGEKQVTLTLNTKELYGGSVGITLQQS